MVSVKLPFLNVFAPKRGGAVAYYRRDGVRVRLYGLDGRPVDPADDVALARAWQAAHDAHEAANTQAAAAAAGRQVRARSIQDLIDRYRASPEWAEKGAETKRDYEKALKPLERDWGHLLVAGLLRHHVTRVRDRYAWRTETGEDGAETRVPNARQANRIVTVLSILLSFAVDPMGWRTDNPALRPRRLRKKGDDFRPWTKAEFAQFWDRTTDDWRFATLLAVLTSQRGQDLVAMRWADYNGTELHVVQQKGNGQVKLWLYCPAILREQIDARHKAVSAMAVVPLTILLRPDGTSWLRPDSKSAPANAFQKAAGKAIRAAGLKGPVWHGLRATAASWSADGQATEKQLQAMLGHLSPAMSQHYARGAQQRQLARAAIEAIELPIENASGPPSGKHKGRRVANKGRMKP